MSEVIGYSVTTIVETRDFAEDIAATVHDYYGIWVLVSPESAL